MFDIAEILNPTAKLGEYHFLFSCALNSPDGPDEARCSCSTTEAESDAHPRLDSPNLSTQFATMIILYPKFSLNVRSYSPIQIGDKFPTLFAFLIHKTFHKLQSQMHFLEVEEKGKVREEERWEMCVAAAFCCLQNRIAPGHDLLSNSDLGDAKSIWIICSSSCSHFRTFTSWGYPRKVPPSIQFWSSPPGKWFIIQLSGVRYLHQCELQGGCYLLPGSRLPARISRHQIIS